MTKTRQQETRNRIGRPGHIAEAARSLGVERSHLWRVVRGHRHSRRLLREYTDWRKKHLGQ